MYKAKTYDVVADIHKQQFNNLEALKNRLASLEIKQEIGNKVEYSNALISVGRINYDLGNYPEALKNYWAALKIDGEAGFKKGMAATYIDIGNVYSMQGNDKEALTNYTAALAINEGLNDKQSISYSYGNIGYVYQHQGNFAEALKNYYESLKINEALGDSISISSLYSNIGNVYAMQGNYQESLQNFLLSLKIRETIKDKAGTANSCINIGMLFILQKRFNEAEKYLLKAKGLSTEIGFKEYQKETYEGLTELYAAKGDYKGAYESHRLYILFRDSIDNEETRKKTIQGQLTFNFEKKEAETQAAQDKKDIVAKEELKQKQQERNFFIVGFALIALLSLLILRSYRQKQKANVIITRQKKEVENQKSAVEEQKHIIEEKNKDITDSINYAMRIQKAMLPHRRDIWASFSQSFVLFKPKDIVSGDFYFFHKNNEFSFIAAADCTGHGVPGAFMSMIGSAKLNEAVLLSSDPSVILSLLNNGIKTALKQSAGDDSTRDGMDIALCAVDTKNCILRYAGANRNLWIVRYGQKEIEEIKATKAAIGGLTENDHLFDSQEIKLQKGDSFYIFTDGFADQFGGKAGKKLMTKKLKEILLDIQNKSMREQEKYLEAFIDTWRGNNEQIDDILVIGIRM